MNSNINFNASIARLAGLLSNKMSKSLHNNLKLEGLTITSEQFVTLNVLWEKEGINQQTLANILVRERATIVRLIDTLEKYDYLERRKHKTDRRTNLIYLTKKGNDIKDSAKRAAETTLKNALTGVSQDELDILKIGLNKIIRNIE